MKVRNITARRRTWRSLPLALDAGAVGDLDDAYRLVVESDPCLRIEPDDVDDDPEDDPVHAVPRFGG